MVSYLLFISKERKNEIWLCKGKFIRSRPRYTNTNAKNENCDEFFSEKVTSNIRKKIKRNELDKLIDKLKVGDTLVVSKLDRLARSTQQALTVIQELFERELIVERMHEGKQLAKLDPNFKEGRPKTLLKSNIRFI